VTRSTSATRRLSVQFLDSDEDDERSSWATCDVIDYRNDYPNKKSKANTHTNFDFYTNRIPSIPDGDLIDNIHKHWFGQYEKLEFHHGYIQWLFPIRVRGMNFSADPLEENEIEAITQNPEAMQRVLRSYKLM
jgi:hypothetical protein